MIPLFEDRLKNARLLKGETQQETAKNLGLPYTTYRNYELNLREPSAQTLISIATYFNVSLNYLLGFEEGEPPVLNDLITKQILDYISEFSDKEKQKVKEYCGYIKYLRNKTE